MTTWALAHPWMTLAIAYFGLLSISHTVRVVARGWPPAKSDTDPDGDSDD